MLWAVAKHTTTCCKGSVDDRQMAGNGTLPGIGQSKHRLNLQSHIGPVTSVARKGKKIIGGDTIVW